jgi:HD-like signal output (HDOD) protein
MLIISIFGEFRQNWARCAIIQIKSAYPEWQLQERRKMHSEISDEITNKALLGISIPACPASLTSIMRAAKMPSTDIAKLALLISRDAGLAGPLLKLANSPFVGLRNKATSVFQATSVLGLQNTLNLVQNIALRQSLGGDSPDFEKFWEKSSLTAAIAERLASKFHSISKDDAYLAALFHDCGVPVLMMKFPNYSQIIMENEELGMAVCDIENKHFSTTRAIVGNMLTRSWMLPAHISKTILYHHDSTIFSNISGNIESSVRNLIALVHMAECIADEHLLVRDRAWPKFEHIVLKHFDMSVKEFSELKGDVLAFLNGE